MSGADHSERPFPAAAREALADGRLRANLRAATDTIREKRGRAVAELADWEELREAARAIKADLLANLDRYLLQFEESVIAAGGHVHWASDGARANEIVLELARSHGVEEVVKVKSLTTDEIGLNDALAAGGVNAIETDFAELILQLDGDWPSHILVPAIHRNRTEIRDLFARTIAARRSQTTRVISPRPRAYTCANASCMRAWRSAAPTSASPRPARSASSSPRATAACARRCRRSW